MSNNPQDKNEKIKREKGNSIIKILELTVLTITAFLYILVLRPNSIFIHISIVLLAVSSILSLLALYAINYVSDIMTGSPRGGYNASITQIVWKEKLLHHYDCIFYLLYGLTILLLAFEIILGFIKGVM